MKLKKVFLVLVLFFLLNACRSAEIKDSEHITIREKVINNSFEVGGFARQDSIKREIYFWDTIIKLDTIRTTYDEIRKFQTLQIKAKTDTLRDTIFIKSETKIEYRDVIKYKEVVPKWVWWCLFIAVAEFVIIVMYLRIRK